MINVPEDYGPGQSLCLMGTVVYTDGLETHRELRFCWRYDLRNGRFTAVKNPAYEMED
jgi:hypothetical protein